MKPLGLRVAVWFLVLFRILAAIFAVDGDSVSDALRWQSGYDWFAYVLEEDRIDIGFKLYLLFDFLSLYAALIALVLSLIPYRGDDSPSEVQSEPEVPPIAVPPGITD